MVNEEFTISGRLVYETAPGDRRPLAYRTVFLYCDGTEIGAVQTDESGYYSKRHSISRPGTYTLVAYYPGEQ